ncbi:MAG: hypothetical protein GC182_09060 [Rhodopseudomonas sp.]|nr:hypothetical protein [Rhodopseudomonas sp.]
MTKRREEISPRQLGFTASAVDEFLRSLGITDAVFVKTKHITAKFMFGTRQITIPIPCTPRDETTAARRAIRFAQKKIEEASAALS